MKNARHEGLNRSVRQIIIRAYGFHSSRAVLAFIMLTIGPMDHVLPHERTGVPSRSTHVSAGNPRNDIFRMAVDMLSQPSIRQLDGAIHPRPRVHSEERRTWPEGPGRIGFAVAWGRHLAMDCPASHTALPSP